MLKDESFLAAMQQRAKSIRMRGLWHFKQLKGRLREQWRLRRAMSMVAAFPRIKHKQRHSLPGELIVSLTSYPPRFPTLALTLKSLLDQTIAADRTILWVAANDRARLPSDVLKLAQFGLEICDCEDLRSFKKLIPALEAFPNATIATADDDLYYPLDWLEQLASASSNWPGCIIAHRAHMSVRNEVGAFNPYASWEFETAAVEDQSPFTLLFPTGVGGILYPPGSLHKLVTDVAVFMRLCPNADDVWFFWMARLVRSKTRRIAGKNSLLTWRGSQDVALYWSNLHGDQNDVQITAMEEHFGNLPIVLQKLSIDQTVA